MRGVPKVLRKWSYFSNYSTLSNSVMFIKLPKIFYFALAFKCGNECTHSIGSQSKMAASFKIPLKGDYRSCNSFTRFTNIPRVIATAYGDNILRKCRVFHCPKLFEAMYKINLWQDVTSGSKQTDLSGLTGVSWLVGWFLNVLVNN